MFSGTTEGGGPYGSQYVLDFRSTSEAEQMLAHVVDSRTLCTDPTNEGMKGVGFSSTAAVRVALPDGSQGQRWTMDFERDGYLTREAVSVVRTGTRVSVSVVSGSPDLIKGLRAETLAQRSATRLG